LCAAWPRSFRLSCFSWASSGSAAGDAPVVDHLGLGEALLHVADAVGGARGDRLVESPPALGDDLREELLAGSEVPIGGRVADSQLLGQGAQGTVLLNQLLPDLHGIGSFQTGP